MKKYLFTAMALLLCIVGAGAKCAEEVTLPPIDQPLEEIMTPQTPQPETSAPETPTSEVPYIPIIVKAIESHFFKVMEEGARQAAQDYGVQITFEGTTRGAPIEDQLAMLETALNKSPQAIILSALDSQAVGPYLERAQAAGIPVIGVDSGVNSPIVQTTIATDNYGAGVLAANKLAQLIGGRGKVALIVLDRESKVGTDRSDGFVDTLTQRYPEIEVLPIEYGEGSFERSKEIATQLLTEHPDLKGMFGGNEDASIAIAEAARELGRLDDIKIVGFDAGRVVDAIREGSIEGAILQNPRVIGYEAVRAAFRAFQGENNPEFIDTGFYWYDRSNIDSPQIQSLLYE